MWKVYKLVNSKPKPNKMDGPNPKMQTSLSSIVPFTPKHDCPYGGQTDFG
jgi:hypothetical protein